MPQGMDAALAPQARARDGVIINALTGGIHHRLLRRAGGRKEPVPRTKHPPVSAQFRQQPGREQGVTILAALALDDADLLACRIEVFRLEMTGLVEPQARAIDRHQKGAVLGMRRAEREEPFQFRRAVNLRAENRLAGERQRLAQRFDLAMQHPFVEKAKSVDRLVDGAGGELTFARQMQQVLAHLIIGELVGRLAEMSGQLIDLLDVSFLGPRGAAAQDQFLDELLA